MDLFSKEIMEIVFFLLFFEIITCFITFLKKDLSIEIVLSQYYMQLKSMKPIMKPIDRSIKVYFKRNRRRMISNNLDKFGNFSNFDRAVQVTDPSDTEMATKQPAKFHKVLCARLEDAILQMQKVNQITLKIILFLKNS